MVTDNISNRKGAHGSDCYSLQQLERSRRTYLGDGGVPDTVSSFHEPKVSSAAAAAPTLDTAIFQPLDENARPLQVGQRAWDVDSGQCHNMVKVGLWCASYGKKITVCSIWNV